MAGDTPNGPPRKQSTASGKSQSNGLSLAKSDENDELERTDTVRTIGKFKLRGKTDDLPQDWWFASTAIPLLAATIGPLANVLSIAALVSTWRVSLPNNGQLPEGADEFGQSIPDPHWELILNGISLGCGFFGNFSLLLNFTQRIRYIIALPMTILSWYFATGILTGIIIAMNQYVPPIRPGETYSQGFWYAIIASALYMIGSMMLMANMLGYFLGHYPQHFDLDDDQRTLILQTMIFFFWLAGGAAVFQKTCGFTYADALYFCNVTVLTIGFGDLVAPNSVGRGLVLPYSVIGVIFLGLMINSIRKFAAGISRENVIRKHAQNERERTFGRTVTSERELRDRLGLPPRRESGNRPSSSRNGPLGSVMRRTSLDQYGHFDINGRTITFHEHKSKGGGGRGGAGSNYQPKPANRDAKLQQRAENKGLIKLTKRTSRREKLVLLKEEKDRFDAMRDIQAHTHRFKQYYSLAMSILMFGIVWCVGALVFMFAEQRMQQLTYFEALYFCWVSLLTIGYGDFSPKSNPGKPFFVVWSLIAIPTMTVLISDLSETVVSAYNRATFLFADWTIMPKEGVWRDFLENHPKLKEFVQQRKNAREARKRIEAGFSLQNPDEETGLDENGNDNLLENLAEEPPEVTDHDLARKLAIAIKKTANDLRLEKPKKYNYEEWVEFTRLIRFSSKHNYMEIEREEEEEGLIEWDWIGEDSPMLADVTESEWVLDRLCESLNRYTRKMSRDSKKTKHLNKNFHVDDDDDGEDDDLKKKHSKSRPYPQLNNKKSMRRQKIHHDRHIETYPAHPGKRGEHSTTYKSGSSSPVGLRSILRSGGDGGGDDGVEGRRAGSEKLTAREINMFNGNTPDADDDRDGDARADGGETDSETRGNSSGNASGVSTGGSGDMSATTAVGSPINWEDSAGVASPARTWSAGIDSAFVEGSRGDEEGMLEGDTPVERREGMVGIPLEGGGVGV